MSASESSQAIEPKRFFIEDWLNPVLLKEVRQALRGKYFKICFWITLCAITVVTTGILIDSGDDRVISPYEGRTFATAICTCLGIAVLGFVPFSAFNAMGAEWDENTYDLLVISNVRPRGIVLGKLLSSGVQALLIYSAFTPYFVLASFMQGIDLRAMLVILAGFLVFSQVLTMVALCLSTLSRVRFARVVLLAALSAVLVYATIGAMFLASTLISDPGLLQDREVPYIALSLVIPHLLVGAYAVGIACVMLAHHEENRSTGMRILTSCAVVVGIAWIYAMMGIAPAEGIIGMGIGLSAALLLPCLFFVTEAERFPRRVQQHVPKNPLLALLAFPYLPGGARGLAFYTLHLFALACGVVAIRARSTGLSGFQLADGGLSFACALLFTWIYLSLPSGILAPFTRQHNLRAAVRAIVPVLLIAFAVLPAVVGFFVDNHQLMNGRHPGNPVFVLEQTWSGRVGEEKSTLIFLLAIGALGLLFNLRRIFLAVMETLAASERTRQLARTAKNHAAT